VTDDLPAQLTCQLGQQRLHALKLLRAMLLQAKSSTFD
jgi:hypothetical protein